MKYTSGMNKDIDHNSVVIESLIKGYQDFHDKYFESGDSTLYQDLVRRGQSPKTMIIACSDSRVDPATILNCSPGEVFVVRNVANLIPPYENDNKHHGTSAALEFAVCFLKVEHIIVFGHNHCGGIQALLNDTMEPAEDRGFIASWMDIAREAKEKALVEHGSTDMQEKHCCEYSLIASLKNLDTFPWIVERVKKGRLALHAWHFDLETGEVRRFNSNEKKFENLL